MKSKSKKKLFNFLFLVLVFGLTLWSVFRGEDLSQVLTYVSTADSMYIFLGVLCVICFILGESVVLFYLMHTLKTKVSFFHCCLYSFIGFFYSCITPSASGGQPMQVVAMRKDKIPVAVSTVVLAIVTITYKLVLVLVGTIILLVRPPKLMMYLEPAESIIYLGIWLNVICITILFLLVFNPNIVRSVSIYILSVIHRIRPLKNIKKHTENIDSIVKQYAGTSEFYRNHKRVIVKVFFITLLQRFLLFLVTWFTYRSFGLAGHSLPVIVSLQAMISVAADMLPLPGGMGISENMFLDIFPAIFGEALVLPGMMISRGISYYTQLFISAVMTMVSALVIRDKR